MADNLSEIWVLTGPVQAKTGKAGAQIAGWGTSKDEYRVGDSVSGYVKVKNTGQAAISDLEVEIAVAKLTLLGKVEVHRQTYRARDFFGDFSIGPGETLEFRFPPKGQPQVTVPNVPMAKGRYLLTGRLTVSGSEIGRLEKTLKIV